MGTPGNQVVVGIIGVTTLEVPQITIASATEGLCFKDPAQSISHYVPAMKAAGAQVIVVLSHLGYPDGGYGYGIPVYGDQTLAKNLLTAGHAGQSDHRRSQPYQPVRRDRYHVRGIPTITTSVVQAYYNGRNVGRADLVDQHDHRCRHRQLAAHRRQHHRRRKMPAAKAQIAVWANDPAYQALINQPIGYTNVDLPRGAKTESMMGNFVDDAIYNYLNNDGVPANDIDMFFNNAGGIRTDWCRIPDPGINPSVRYIPGA